VLLVDRERRVGQGEAWLYGGQEEGACYGPARESANVVGVVVGSKSRWLGTKSARAP
jgi:hypothetical protein